MPWDADASADAAIGLLRDDAERNAHVRAIRAAGARFTWRKTAHTLAKVYEEAAAAPTRHLHAIAMDQIEVEGRLDTTREQLEHARWHFDRVEEAMPELHGELSELRSREELLGEGTMRALTAIAYNPVLRRAILGPIRLLYRVMHARGNES